MARKSRTKSGTRKAVAEPSMSCLAPATHVGRQSFTLSRPMSKVALKSQMLFGSKAVNLLDRADSPRRAVACRSCRKLGAASFKMQKLLLLLFLIVSFRAAAAADAPISALEAIEQFGRVSVSDGTSYFSFAKDGSFDSGPLDLSGRTLRGRWINGVDGRIVVTARLGLKNGISSGNQYRRIVFFIWHVSRRAREPATTAEPPASRFDSHFLIEEMLQIPKPSKDFPD